MLDRIPRLALLVSGLLLACLPSSALADKVEPEEKEDAKSPGSYLAEGLASVRLGKPAVARQLILIPLVVQGPAWPEPRVKPSLLSDEVSYEEPKWGERRYNVMVENKGEQAVLLLGGGLVTGGKLDRMIPHDLLVPAGRQVEIRTLPAEFQREYRYDPGPLERHGALAPAYLRERALNNPSRNLVPHFVSHFLPFRKKGDERLSLAAIDEAPQLAAYCAACQSDLSAFPETAGGNVVGFVTAIHGRVQGLELFGSNDLLRAYFKPLLRAHSYMAAALELRARKLGMPLPEPKDIDATVAGVEKEAAELLDRLRAKGSYRSGRTLKETDGRLALFRAGSAKGYALEHEKKLVHAVVFPYNALERRLYAQPLRPPAPKDEDGDDEPEDAEDPDITELERRAAQGRRLSEYEKRLLERMRRRRARARGDR